MSEYDVICNVRYKPGSPVKRLLISIVLVFLASLLSPAYGQQFNSDNYWVLPHGTGMGILTAGQHYSAMYLGYGFLPKWEADISTTLFEKEEDDATNHFSTSVYVKGLLHENEFQTGGLALMAGIGSIPGYSKSSGVTQDFKNYWGYLPLTLPLFDNRLSWDIMPGVTYNREYGTEKKSAFGFLYSTRLAIYKIIPQSAIVGEVFGTEGEAYTKPEYKAGVRWESKFVTVALTYGAALDGSPGGGLELGIMVMTPPYLCFGGCK